MHFTQIFLTSLATLDAASAVTIRNFRTGTCKGNYRECTRIQTYSCCAERIGNVFSSSLISGMPPTGIGAICVGKQGKNCGEVKKGGFGSPLCLGSGNSKGTFWFDCAQTHHCHARRGARSLDVQLRDISTPDKISTPDFVGIDDHRFFTNETTPEEIVRGLLELVETDVSYDDIPVEFKKYEAGNHGAEMDE
ncbi:hypothetical protein J7337_002064 [Fusarium musae]|uniref:Uncharacterized protein n=1 Tax=Fusarium musae TaxID=1042133 RepID=A0A9P8DNF8_9HYPO|nr:hypothetical protein J7337_002064 [Fusarium musae]KAG9505098.1 hypothetical protein J7337_002064 [Fusarium musae]